MDKKYILAIVIVILAVLIGLVLFVGQSDVLSVFPGEKLRSFNVEIEKNRLNTNEKIPVRVDWSPRTDIGYQYTRAKVELYVDGEKKETQYFGHSSVRPSYVTPDGVSAPSWIKVPTASTREYNLKFESIPDGRHEVKAVAKSTKFHQHLDLAMEEGCDYSMDNECIKCWLNVEDECVKYEVSTEKIMEHQCMSYECCSDSDCKEDGYVGGRYCKNNNVYKKYRDHYCYSNECGYKDTEELIEQCSNVCQDGECVTEPEVSIIDSFFDIFF